MGKRLGARVTAVALALVASGSTAAFATTGGGGSGGASSETPSSSGGDDRAILDPSASRGCACDLGDASPGDASSIALVGVAALALRLTRRRRR